MSARWAAVGLVYWLLLIVGVVDVSEWLRRNLADDWTHYKP